MHRGSSGQVLQRFGLCKFHLETLLLANFKGVSLEGPEGNLGLLCRVSGSELRSTPFDQGSIEAASGWGWEGAWYVGAGPGQRQSGLCRRDSRLAERGHLEAVAPGRGGPGLSPAESEGEGPWRPKPGFTALLVGENQLCHGTLNVHSGAVTLARLLLNP